MRKTQISKVDPEYVSNVLIAYCNVSSVVVISLASSLGLRNGTSAPAFLAQEAISSSSVVTNIMSITPLFSAALIGQVISGFPANN